MFVRTSTLRAALAESDALVHELAKERAARINAETIASERLHELDRVRAQALRFEEAYVGIVKERLTSLDTVNAILMREAAPQVMKEREQGDSTTVEIKPKPPVAPASKIRHKMIFDGLTAVNSRVPAKTA